jgi:hypothetical protein
MIMITTLLAGCFGPYGSYGGGGSSVRGGVYFSVPLCVVGVPCFPSDVLFICFYVNRGAIPADHEDSTKETLGRGCQAWDEVEDSFGDSLSGSFKFCS